MQCAICHEHCLAKQKHFKNWIKMKTLGRINTFPMSTGEGGGGRGSGREGEVHKMSILIFLAEPKTGENPNSLCLLERTVQCPRF